MANIKSAKKRIIQSNKKRIRNKAVKTETRTEVKKLLHMHDQTKDVQQQQDQLKYVQKVLDTAAGKGVIHKNKAARIKSRLAKKVNALSKKDSSPKVKSEDSSPKVKSEDSSPKVKSEKVSTPSTEITTE